MTEATAVEVAMVEEKIARNSRIPARRLCARTARPRPRPIPAGTDKSTYTTVRHRLPRKTADPSTDRYWESPT